MAAHLQKEALVKPLLLVLTEIQDAKTRALVSMVLESAGHRVIEAGGRVQTRTLLSNGLQPDLLICESAPNDAAESASYRELLNLAPARSICLITRVSEQGLYREADELGIKRVLTMPLTREDVESVIDPAAPARQEHPAGRAIAYACTKNVAAGPRDFAVSASAPEGKFADHLRWRWLLRALAALGWAA